MCCLITLLPLTNLKKQNVLINIWEIMRTTVSSRKQIPNTALLFITISFIIIITIFIKHLSSREEFKSIFLCNIKSLTVLTPDSTDFEFIPIGLFLLELKTISCLSVLWNIHRYVSLGPSQVFLISLQYVPLKQKERSYLQSSRLFLICNLSIEVTSHPHKHPQLLTYEYKQNSVSSN